jgi:PAS domain-containing protein
LYALETPSLRLREEDGLKVFENTALRRIFGLKRDRIIGGWRKFLNEELHNLYSLPNVIRQSGRMGWSEQVVRIESGGMHVWFWWERQKDRGR